MTKDGSRSISPLIRQGNVVAVTSNSIQEDPQGPLAPDTRSGVVAAKTSVAALALSLLTAISGGIYALKNEHDKKNERRSDRFSVVFDENSAAVQKYFASVAAWKACEFQYPTKPQEQRKLDCFEPERDMIRDGIAASGSLAKVRALGSAKTSAAAEDLYQAADQYRHAGDDPKTTEVYKHRLDDYQSTGASEIRRLSE